MSVPLALFAVWVLLMVAAHGATTAWFERRTRRDQQVQAVRQRLLGVPHGAVQESSAMVQQPRTWWDAVHEWLLPHAHHPVDPGEQRTFLRLDIRVRLDWADRLRLLLCGDMRVLSTVYTDVEVKQCSAHTNIEVHPFTLPERP